MSSIDNLLDMFLVIMAIYLAFYVIFSITNYIKGKQIKKKQDITIFLPGKSDKKSNNLYSLYTFFSNWPPTKSYFNKISDHFKQITIKDERSNNETTMNTVLKIWMVNILIIIVLFALKPNLLNAIITIAYLIIINNETVSSVYRKLLLKLHMQFSKWLGDYIYNYQGNNNIMQSLYDTIDNTPYPLKEHIKSIYAIFESEDQEDESLKYLDRISNRFIKIFLTTSIVTQKYGDKVINEKSLYLTNIGIMKKELDDEILNIKKKNMILNPVIPFIIFPMATLGLIRSWATYSFPELESYYVGGLGIITVFLIILVTVAFYNYFNRLKDDFKINKTNTIFINYLMQNSKINNWLDNVLDKHYSKKLSMEKFLKSVGEKLSVKEFFLKRIIYSICTFLIVVLLSLMIHAGNRNIALNNMNSINYLGSDISQEEEKMLKAEIKNYLDAYKNTNITEKELEEELIKKAIIKNKKIATLTAKEIVNKINKYQNEYYKWYELIAALIISVIAFFIPLRILKKQKGMRQRVMQDEVIQFNSVILMLMYVEQMSKDVILEWLELYADVFKNSLQICITEMGAGSLDALENLKIREPYIPFVRIVENIQNTDKLFIKDAFAGVPEERNGYINMRIYDNEAYRRKITTKVNLYIFGPMTVVIYGYLLMPLLIETFGKWVMNDEMMNSLIK